MLHSKMYIGCHLSSTKGFAAMGKTALSIGADTFAFFTRNPRGGKAKDIDPKDISLLSDILKENNFGPLVAHAPYTMNPCSADAKTREFAYMAMTEDLKKLEYLPGNYYNFHPGSHVGQGAEKGIDLISEMLNQILTEEQSTVVLLETMSGKGSEVGRSFDEIASIIDKVNLKDKIGVCLDTCHIHDGGYDIVKDFDSVLKNFKDIIGLNYLKALHINDSKNPLGTHKDRHACIGDGFIGTDTIKYILNHHELPPLPCILETPQESLDGYAKEIKMLRDEI